MCEAKPRKNMFTPVMSSQRTASAGELECSECQCESQGVDCRVPCGHCEAGGDLSTPRPVRVNPPRAHRMAHLHTFPALFTRESAVALLLVWCLLRPSAASPARHKTHWKNPCALPMTALSGETVLHLPPSSDRAILDRIIHLNGRVVPQVNDHLTKFVTTTYHTDPASMQRDWGHHSLDWLRWVGETIRLQEERLSTNPLQIGDVLRTQFGDLQRLAVAFEQTTLDAALHGDHSLDSFRELQQDLMRLLCEFHLGLLEKRLQPDTSTVRLAAAQRHHQPETTRERHLRDWILLSQYLRYVNHVDHVLRTLRDQQQKQSR